MAISVPLQAHRIAERLPAHVFFLVSALFHYLGPAFAVLLFARIEPLGVAWLRIGSAAIVFILWRRPWRFIAGLSRADLWRIAALGLVLAAMNCSFYEAIARLPLASVGAIEFLGPIVLAAIGLRSRRNLGALILAAGGVYLLTRLRFEGAPLAYTFAFANCALFMLYIVLGHRIAGGGGSAGIDRLAAAMTVAMTAALPAGIGQALPAFGSPALLLAAVGVGISSSLIPYCCDQLAMARLPRATFALLLSLLPATASAIGILVLGQWPSLIDCAGIAAVAAGVALHREN